MPKDRIEWQTLDATQRIAVETCRLQACGSLCNVPNRCYWLDDPLGMQPGHGVQD